MNNLIFANFEPKIGCHGNVPWVMGERGQLGNLRSSTYQKIRWKSVQ